MGTKIETQYFSAIVKNARDAGVIRVTKGNVDRWPESAQLAILNAFNGQYEYYDNRQDACKALEEKIEKAENRLAQLRAAYTLGKRKSVRVEFAPIERKVIKIDHMKAETTIHMDWTVCSSLDANKTYSDLPKNDHIEYRIIERETE